MQFQAIYLFLPQQSRPSPQAAVGRKGEFARDFIRGAAGGYSAPFAPPLLPKALVNSPKSG